ncbi:MAG TPA: SpoIIE family protein phosphatase [Pirellulaceae bacterium]|jgi:serine phosphatase RsbU (regulator of sigma subunit)
MYYIVANNGPQAGRKYELKTDKYVMGRHPDCQIVIEVGAVSRNHCQIIRDGNDYKIEDLNSRNGTFVNEEADKVTGRRTLKPGDVIRVCEVSFTYGTDAPQSKAASASGAPLGGVAPTGPLGQMLDGAGLGAFISDDDAKSGGSTIMSKLEVSSSSRGISVSASPEVKLAAMIEIMQSLGRALSLDEVLPQVLKSLFKIFVQADRGFIVMLTPDDKLIPRWVRLRREDAADTLRISRTIIRHVIDTKEAILSADAASDERFEMSQSIADFRIRSMMCAPLLDSEGKAFGALQIDTLDQRQRFTKEDLELLVSTASQAALAIQQAQLHEQAIAQKEMERDMKLARDVQHGFLPDKKPELPGYEFFDFYQPTADVGGDYFDYIKLADGRQAVIVADVVGHGVAAALLTAKLSSETKFSLYSEASPAIAVTKLNERLCASNMQRFVTMIMVIIDPVKHTATIVNAGHMAPLVWRAADGTIEEPSEDTAGLPIGVTDALGYDQCEVDIRPGDTFTLYTDGINESIDASGAFYTIERLREQVKKYGADAKVVGPAIVEDGKLFLGKAPQVDDMCLVCFGRVK